MENKQLSIQGYSPSREYTIQEWVEWLGRKVPDDKKLSVSDFLALKLDDVDNLNRIWSQYNSELRKKYEQNYNNNTLPEDAPILEGTPVVSLLSKIEIEFQKITQQGQFMSQSSFKAFWADNYEKIIGSINYKPEYSETKDDSSFDVRIIPQSIRVWIYINALGKIIDISPFVISCNTNKTALNGAFAVRLTPVRNQASSTGYGGGFFEHFSLTDENGNINKNYWERYINQNDIVFIRFEKLLLEKEATLQGTSDSLEIPPNNLVNNNSNYNVWDMIGLVDSCTTSYASQPNSAVVDIMGRDFSKLFTEDGSYFMPLKWVEGSRDRWFYGGDPSDSWFQRNVITGNYNYIFNYGFKKIRETLWFLINILSNIGIVPDDLFKAYGERRTEAYVIEDDDNVHKTQQVKGIWQIVKVFVEDTLEDRSIVDPSFTNPDGTLMSFINKICQPPFVEVIFDTYVDTLDIVVRQPPFTEEAINDVVKSKTYIEIEPGNLLGFTLNYDDRVYSWYQLFPQNNFIGTRLFTSLAFVPIIYFEEFTKIWGNKKQVIQDIYISLSAIDGAGGTNQLNSMGAAALNDLLYVIETSVYLPFTRRGTIIINGDRRIKVGTFIKLNATNELFYVTGVSQEAVYSGSDLVRTTRIDVERGMYLPILTGDKNGKEIELNTSSGDKASYFKIARLKEMRADIKQAEKAANSPDKVVNSGKQAIDSAQFNYFFNRRMYDEKD